MKEQLIEKLKKVSTGLGRLGQIAEQNTINEAIAALTSVKSEQVTNNSEVIKWVSVEDRLPEINQNVIVQFKNKRIDICKYTKVFEMEFVENAVCVTENVTHWMPLPTPPNQ